MGFLVKSSGNFATWSLWNVPAPPLWFSASNFVATITGPLTREASRFFRAPILEP